MTTTTISASPVRTAGGWTWFDRFIGTCKACKARNVETISGTAALFDTNTRPCQGCGAPVVLAQVVGAVREDVTCGARCRNAKGGDCECSCGGAHHGQG